MIKNEYAIGKLRIIPNYGEDWPINLKNKKDIIFIENKDDENMYLDMSLKEAKNLINVLDEIIDFYETIPKYNDQVKIIDGIFKNYEGKIIDIDENDEIRPLTIEVNCSEFDGNVYVNYDQVEIIK